MKTALPTRLIWLDFWRALAAMAIIWLHTPQSDLMSPTTIITRFAVPFFAATAGFMACRISNATSRKSFPTFLASRLNRIYLPFLGWSVIIFVTRAVASQLVSNVHVPPVRLNLLWQGPSNHLWFLPFILVATTGADLLGRLLSRFDWLGWPIAMALVGVAAVTGTDVIHLGKDLPYTLHLSYETLPALCLGISLAILCAKRGREWLAQRTMIVLSLLAFASLQGALIAIGRDSLLENLCGFALLLSCFGRWTPSWADCLSTLGAAAYGVYLSHVLFVEGFQDFADLASLPYNALNDFAIFSLSALGALTLTRLLQQSRFTQWLVP